MSSMTTTNSISGFRHIKLKINSFVVKSFSFSRQVGFDFDLNGFLPDGVIKDLDLFIKVDTVTIEFSHNTQSWQ